MRTKVSVVVPVYNAESTIFGCLKSLTQQNYLPDEIIIVDNFSTDRSFEIIQDFLKKSIFSRLCLVRESKRGAAAARNRGVALAQSEIIAFTDADCQVPPDWIEKIILAFKKTPNPDIVVGTAVGLQLETALNQLMYILRHKASSISSQRIFDENSFFRGPVFATLNVALRKSVFLKLSGFDESFGQASGEDTDFYLRALREKVCIVFHPEIQVFHQERANIQSILKQSFNYRMNDAKNFKRFFSGTFNLTLLHIFFFHKYLGWGTIWMDKFIWLLLLWLIIFIPFFFGKWLFGLLLFMVYLGAGIFYMRFLNLKAGLKLKWPELLLMFFCYGLKQLGDISGRIVGSFKYRVFFL